MGSFAPNLTNWIVFNGRVLIVLGVYIRQEQILSESRSS